MIILPLARDEFLRSRDHVFDRESKVRRQILVGCRIAEGGHPDHIALESDPLVPTQWRAGLDGEALAVIRRQHRIAIGLRLALEDLESRHSDAALRMSF